MCYLVPAPAVREGERWHGCASEMSTDADVNICSVTRGRLGTSPRTIPFSYTHRAAPALK